MGQLNDLTNTEFGCWKILSQAEHQYGEAGDKRVQWNIECGKCGHTFVTAARNIRRKRNFPTGCDQCGKREYPELGKWTRNVNGFAIRPDPMES